MATTPAYRSVLARGEGWVLRACRWKTGYASLEVLARSQALADRVLADAARGASEAAPADPHRAAVGFWHGHSRGSSRVERTVAVAPWDEIRANCSGDTAAAIDRVMAVVPEAARGRLLLLHGPPGTGKTTALRALAHSWRRWCQVDYVLDPERLLNDSGYLLAAALGDDDEPADRWRLLVLEDCDELIGAGAKAATGQALARLLNLTDGLLGQGLRLLVALTTNEPLDRLHPAIVRPGRCLAQIEVGRLTPAEVRRWLGRSLPLAAEGVTLAELCALRGDGDTIEHRSDPVRLGQYL